jgi:hypothetical protein
VDPSLTKSIGLVWRVVFLWAYSRRACAGRSLSRFTNSVVLAGRLAEPLLARSAPSGTGRWPARSSHVFVDATYCKARVNRRVVS